MPIHKPNKGESKQDFISRNMSNETMKSEYPDQKQRSAVCNFVWDNAQESIDNRKRDEQGRVIVAENVPIVFGATIEG